VERNYEVGQHVIFVDPKGRHRHALVTIWWKDPNVEPYTSEAGEPGCNLIIVSDDEKKNDTFGRQTEHETSVVHESSQPAHGNYWCWPDE
jgi:hypothetical protein